MDWQTNGLFLLSAHRSHHSWDESVADIVWVHVTLQKKKKKLSFPPFVLYSPVPPATSWTFHRLWGGHGRASGHSLSCTCAFDLLVHTVTYIYDLHMWWVLFIYWSAELARRRLNGLLQNTGKDVQWKQNVAVEMSFECVGDLPPVWKFFRSDC